MVHYDEQSGETWPALPKRQWPRVKFKEKRAIKLEEHQRIIADEMNPERKVPPCICLQGRAARKNPRQGLPSANFYNHSLCGATIRDQPIA